jgi:hypothetical protein
LRTAKEAILRPIYENGQTRAAEEATIRMAAERWGVSFAKLPIQYRVDWALIRGGAVAAWCECKRRHNNKGKYSSLMLSLSKVTHGLELARQTGLPFLVVVEWDDCLAYWKADRISGVRLGGRVDRGDWQDVEPVVDIGVELFVGL